ncbi:MAG: TrmH family RNA methyltransferase [Eubacteriales bacterium]
MIKENTRFADSSVFEGMTSLRAVLQAAEKHISDRRILRVLYDRDRADSHARELAYLRHMSREFGFPVLASGKEEIDALATGTSHGGILAECSARTIPPLTDASLPEHGFVVMLEGIEDPYNFGYALRTVYAAGADAVILSPRNWMTAAGVVCRSSAGASELLPLFCSDASEAAAQMRAAGYKVVCAGIRDSVSAFDADLKKPVFLIVGGEKRGISRAVLEAADVIVRLDYGRPFAGSLSAASAASVLAYEVFRQNRDATMPSPPSEP